MVKIRLLKASFASAGILVLVGCFGSGGEGFSDQSEYYDGLERQAELNATEAIRDELSERARQDEWEYRATEDWHRLHGVATEEAYEATYQAAYEQGLAN